MAKAMMTTREAAEILGVTSEYIRLEVLDGRLKATVTCRKTKRMIRFTREQFDEYLKNYWRPTQPEQPTA